MEALTSRAAKLPRIDLGPPRTLIGKSTVDAIRSGIVYGFAGQVDAHHHPAARRARRRGAHDRHRRAGRAHRPVLRHGGRGRRPAYPEGAQAPARAQRMRQLTDPWALGPLTIPNRVVLAPLAGIGNWFVRLQAHRHGAGLAVSEMVSSFGDPLRQREDHHRDAAHPSRGGARLDPALRPGPGRHALGGRGGRARPAPHLIDLNMGCPVPKVCKTGAGAALLKDPDTAVAVARAAAEGSGLPVTVKLRSGQRKGETDGYALAHRLVDEAGRRRDRLPPALGAGPPQGRARLRPRREARRVARRAGDPHRRDGRRRERARRLRAHRRRGRDDRPRRRSATRGCSRSCSAAARRRRRGRRSSPSSTG